MSFLLKVSNNMKVKTTQRYFVPFITIASFLITLQALGISQNLKDNELNLENSE